jgi:hypothetical protein
MPPKVVFDGIELGKRKAEDSELLLRIPKLARNCIDLPQPARPEISQLPKNSLRIYFRSEVNVVSMA